MKESKASSRKSRYAYFRYGWFPLFIMLLGLNVAGCGAQSTTGSVENTQPQSQPSSESGVALSNQLEDPFADFSAQGKSFTRVLDEQGNEAGEFQLGSLPKGTKSLIFSAVCSGKGGYRLFDESQDEAYLLMSACGVTANITVDVNRYKPPLKIWSSGNFRVVVLASPMEQPAPEK
ncbi:MAG: hypothetical protein PT944_01800 [Actinomycetaceae bacterium]|nr:hypothetical protein [Actinomycetaceae bacterium]